MVKDSKAGAHQAKANRAKRMAESFIAQMKERSQQVGPGEQLALKLPGADLARPMRSVDVRVRGGEEIVLNIGWLDGTSERFVYDVESFKPGLQRIQVSAPEPVEEAIETVVVPNRAAENIFRPVDRSMFEQLIGHMTAIGVLQAQRVAREAGSTADPAAYLAQEKARALTVLQNAHIAAPGLVTEAIKKKALGVVSATFDGIQVQQKTPQTIN